MQQIDCSELQFAKDGPIKPAVDKAGSDAAKERSGGRCEVWELLELGGWLGRAGDASRCPRRATQVHHMIGGRGSRSRGLSALADHKQHVCDSCHFDITGRVGGKKLIRIGGPVPVWTDTYRRVR